MMNKNQDEAIRKALISYFQSFPYNSLEDAGIDAKDAIAWLERQGEQETLCDKCKKSQPSHSCQDITALGRCAVEYEQKSKTRRMTHQELAWWLRDKPEEHRELKMSVDDPIVDSLYYYDNETNVTVSKDIIIRRNGGEWEEPLIIED